MEGYKHISKIREYLDYIEEHLQNVEKAWEILQDKCPDMKFVYDDYMNFTIKEMVKYHDLSKFSNEEFIPYQRNFFPIGEKTECGFKFAWEHHKACNPHHWQNWTTLEDEVVPNELECHCVCMVVDWVAMGLKFDDSAQAYYEKNKEQIDLPDWAVEFIYEIFDKIKQEK